MLPPAPAPSPTRAPLSAARIHAGQLALVLETAVAGTITTDLRNARHHWSPGVLRLLGHPQTREAQYSMSLPDCIHPDDLTGVLAQRDRCMATDAIVEHAYRLRRADGTWVWVKGTVRAMRDEHGEPVMLIGYVRDISASRALQDRLLASEQRYRAMFSASPLPMLVLDDVGMQIVEVNLAALSLYGYSQDELVGQPATMLFEPGHCDRFESLLGSAPSTEVGSTHMQHVRSNGTLLEVECRICRIDSGDAHASVLLVNDLTEQIAARAEIRRLAAIDPLTQLPNRLALVCRIEQAIEHAKTHSQSGALLHVNLDSFRSVNDALGYEGANRLLVEIARRLSDMKPACEMAARVAGDEFVLLIGGLPTEESRASQHAEELANRVLNRIREPVRLDGKHYLLTASIGVTLFDEQTLSADHALRSADAAVERSRLLGRNQVRFCDPSMQQAVERRAALEMDLRRALRSNQFELHYQVQVDEAMRPVGAETLLRWKHPSRGMIPPLEFISLAEETGTIIAIGRWVLEQACRRLAEWAHEEPFSRMRLSVNVSARQFRQPEFVAQVRECLAVTGASPGALTLELTESLLLDYAEEAIGKMNEIRALGVRFSLDDFGTGYSSLAYLKRLPLDELKIDRTFTRDVMSDPGDAVIVRTIIGMARTLGLTLIAEGVEGDDQHRLLAQWGCTGFQGYHYGKPQRIDEFLQAVETALQTSRGGAMLAPAADEGESSAPAPAPASAPARLRLLARR